MLKSKWVVLLVVFVLSIGLVTCGVASFWGFGIQQVGARHVRGISVVGGGPSAGK